MEINGFTIANEEKWKRAVVGTIGAEGKMTGGVGESASDEAKLAEYDKLGGLVLKGKYKVKMGSFYDFEKRVARKTPVVTLVLTDLNGDKVEISEDEEVPLEVKAAEIRDAKATAKKVAAKKAKKPKNEEEE